MLTFSATCCWRSAVTRFESGGEGSHGEPGRDREGRRDQREGSAPSPFAEAADGGNRGLLGRSCGDFSPTAEELLRHLRWPRPVAMAAP
jgi:hypothetical protein